MYLSAYVNGLIFLYDSYTLWFINSESFADSYDILDDSCAVHIIFPFLIGISFVLLLFLIELTRTFKAVLNNPRGHPFLG